MIAGLRDLVEEYSSLLTAYLRAPTEALRERAYKLGMEAIGSGLGVLDVVSAHREALLGVLSRSATPRDAQQAVMQATEYLPESLVAFEMTHRGYRETIHKLVATNDALRKSEAKNTALLDAIPDTMFRLSKEGVFLDFKPKGQGAVGASPDAIVGRKAQEVLRADVAQHVMECVGRALETDEVQVFEFRWVERGQPHDYEVRLGVSGKDEVLGVVRDVTERKRAEREHEKLVAERAARAQAQAAQERISNILESITDGFFALDSRWRYTYLNRQAERLLRRRREDLIGKAIWEETPALVGSPFDREFHRAVTEGVTVHIQDFYPPLGTWLDVRAYPSRDGLSVYFEDITERRHHERARLGLARIAQQIAATTDPEKAPVIATSELVANFEVDLVHTWLWDEPRQELVLRASEGLSTWSASPDSHLERIRLGESVIGRIAANHQAIWSNELRGEAQRLELEWAARAGMVAFAGFPLLVGGRLLGVLGLFSRRPFDEDDLTALGTLADQLSVAIEKGRLLTRVQAALKLRGEFIDAAAHELRTPVTVLRGYAGLLLKGVDPHSPVFDKALRAIDFSAKRIDRLAQELAQADVLEHGTLTPRRERFDLADLVHRAVEVASTEQPEHRFHLTATPAVVCADRDLIGQVIQHLLENATKYQPRGPEIEVTVGVEGQEAVVKVRDLGPGIPPERQPHVFEPMYEPIPAGSVGYVGVVGLGLGISKRLIELHGGRMWVESDSGRGSTFQFALELAPEGELEGPCAGT